MRSLTPREEQKLKVLTENSVSLTLIEPTATALEKGIIDATGSVRKYLKDKGLHNYEIQGQGAQENGVKLKANIYTEKEVIKSIASLYRPKAKGKGGDPRIWFYGVNKHAHPNDILALICFDEMIHIINLSQLPVIELINSVLLNPLKELIEEINSIENAVSVELLQMLRKISGSPIPSMVDADTSVGRTLETALGIDINSSPLPDYKGIELKSFRSKKGNRKSLFAQVPDWKLSKFKSSAEILDAFGYWREEDFKLYCTVSAINYNSQELSLKVDSEINHLIEKSSDIKIGDFAVWTLDKLHERLLEKHRETFWVTADSVIIDGKEHFQYREVEHTKKPITSQFDLLLDQGIITLDHSIKRNSKGKVVEKGPFFKLKSNSLDLLFPPSKKHQLIQNH